MGQEDLAEPTPNEIYELAKLTSTIRPCSPNVPRTLKSMQKIMSPSWVSAFLFTSSPIHVRHILSSSISMSSVLWASAQTWVDLCNSPPTAPTCHGDTQHYCGNLLFAPVCTRDQTTVGIGVHNGKVSSPSPVFAETAKTGSLDINFRFALDIQSATLLQVFDLDKDDVCMIVTSTLVSSCQVRRCRGFFARDSIRQAALCEGGIKLHHLMSDLKCTQEALYNHTCTVCGADESGLCGCRLALPPVMTVRDHNAFFAVMRHFTASSTTIATATCVDSEGGEEGLPPVCASRMTNFCKTDPDIVLQMCSWSIWDFTKNLKEDPLLSYPLTEQTKSDMLLPQYTTGFLNTPNVHNQHSFELETYGFPELDPRLNSRNQLQTAYDNNMFSFETAVRHEQLSQSIKAFEQWPIAYAGDSTAVAVPDTCYEINRPEVMSLQPVEQEVRPLETKFYLPVDASRGRTVRSAYQANKLAKEERRKRANRAAARKSNLKKKEQYEKLEFDLKANHLKIESLRATEMRLRHINMELRTRLNDNFNQTRRRPVT